MKSPTVHCILMNPTIDKILQIPYFKVGGTFKIEKEFSFPLGKSISVAMALKELMSNMNDRTINSVFKIRIFAYIGEEEINIYSNFLINYGFSKEEFIFIPISKKQGKTRSNITIVDTEINRSTHLRFKGFTLIEKDFTLLFDYLKTEINRDDFVIFSGSLPPGSPPEFYFKPAEIIKKNHAHLIIDTSGERLKSMVLYNPYLIKANLEEMSIILGKSLLIEGEQELSKQPDIEEIYDLLDSLESLCKSRVKYTILTLGDYGSILCNPPNGHAYYAKIKLKMASYTVGCGDSFLAGFLIGILNKSNIIDCLRLATASGAANTLKIGAGLLDYSTVKKLLEKVEIIQLK